jgi:hypothetical protein
LAHHAPAKAFERDGIPELVKKVAKGRNGNKQQDVAARLLLHLFRTVAATLAGCQERFPNRVREFGERPARRRPQFTIL